MIKKRTSVKDIASKLNISLSTVHKALTGKPGVSEARRNQVLAVAEELGYAVNAVAQSLARKNMNLGIVLPLLWQEYFGELKAGIEEEIASLSEYRVIGSFFYITNTTTEDEIRDWISENNTDLLIICSSNNRLKETLLRATEAIDIPVFRVGGGTDNPDSTCDITIDAPLSGKLAADFFACSATDEIHSAVFTGSLDVAIHKAKTDSFCERISDYSNHQVVICETDDDEDIAYTRVCELFANDPTINCIYINTSTSKNICRYIKEHNLTGKIKVIGTDVFCELQQYIKSGVMQATIYQNQQKVGRYAVRHAYEYLNMKNSYGSCDKEPERNVLITPTLLLRANIE